MINDIGYLFRNLVVIENHNPEDKRNVLILNPEDYKRFYEQFKNYEKVKE